MSASPSRRDSDFAADRLSYRRCHSPNFIEPCLPSPADEPPSGPNWIHEIKHDGYRLMARRDAVGIRLLTRSGNDWSNRFPLVVEAVNHLKVRSCLIDGEVVCCDERGLAVYATPAAQRGLKFKNPEGASGEARDRRGFRALGTSAVDEALAAYAWTQAKNIRRGCRRPRPNRDGSSRARRALHLSLGQSFPR